MAVRRRGWKWIATAYDPAVGYARHIGTYRTREEAEGATLGERRRPACQRRLPFAESVYFIACDDLGLVKIGRARDVVERFSHIARGFPYPLRLAYVREGGRDLEREIHLRLADQRVRGEWFRLEGELAEFLSVGRLHSK